jgi:hypothetical protein
MRCEEATMRGEMATVAFDLGKMSAAAATMLIVITMTMMTEQANGNKKMDRRWSWWDHFCGVLTSDSLMSFDGTGY